MAKKNPEVTMRSYGVYTPFDRESEELPHILEFTETVPARVGVEFGYILEIRKARGSLITFRIEHPPFTDSSGEVAPPFEGEQYVRTPEWRFFLGDTVWEPAEDKVGDWTLTTWLDGEEVARRTFELVPPEQAADIPVETPTA
jgi:hypothetical protein